MALLKTILSPLDLKKFTYGQLYQLSQEIRKFMIEKVETHGGHLSSNLGVVELTLALHRVFDFSKDRLIWDVSHQSYVHKILTGRSKGFDNLRQWQGLSGFTDPDESIFDVVKVGHAGSSLSTALGLITGYEQENPHNLKKVVAVIGDAAISNGMAFEALNHLSHLKKNLIVILNDNQMSISKTIGGLSKHLAKFLSGNLYHTLKKDVEKFLNHLPIIGEALSQSAKSLVKVIKKNINPTLFEEFGIHYLGPLDGHDIEKLEKTLKNASFIKGPVLIHILTKKGKGWGKAEEDPTHYHGISAKTSQESPSYTQVFGNKMQNLAKTNANFSVITAAMTHGTGLASFAQNFSHRYFDVGIAEGHGVAFAGGISLAGHKPVVAIYSTFLQRALDQMFQEVSLQKESNPLFVVDRAGLVGEDGPTHHGTFDIAYTKFLPRMVLMAPKDGQELESMLEFGLSLNYPAVIRFPKGGFNSFNTCPPITLGKAEVLQEKQDAKVTLLSYGSLTGEILKIKEKFNFPFNWVNLRFAKPFDKETLLKFAKKGVPIISLEEHSLIGGVGQSISSFLLEQGVFVPFLKIGLKDQYYSHGKRDILLQEAGLSGLSLVNQITDFVKKQGGHHES